jgi:hypothetical protein
MIFSNYRNPKVKKADALNYFAIRPGSRTQNIVAIA